MTDERHNLDGVSQEFGQKATGQVGQACRVCLELYNRTHCRYSNYERAGVQRMLRYFEDNVWEMNGHIEVYRKWLDRSFQIDLHDKRVVELAKPRVRKHAGHLLGAREFTLTYSPQWGISDEQACELMVQAIKRLIKYYKNEIDEFVCVGERTKSGNAHIHCYYLLHGGKKISDKNFARAYKYWDPKKILGRRGHQGGHHELVQNECDFKGYIDKCPDAWYKYSFVEDQHKDVFSQNDETTSVFQDPQTASSSEGGDYD